MRKVSVVRLLAVLALVLLAAGPVRAQSLEAAVGWAPSYITANGTNTTAPVGAMFDVAGSVFPAVKIVGDLGYMRRDDGKLLTGTAGVRFVVPGLGLTGISPFVEGLVGLGYLNVSGVGSNTGLAYGAGAGVDIKAAPMVRLRLQLNYFRTQAFGGGFNQIRFGVGIALASPL